MALQDLVTNNRQISADLVEKLLKGRVDLIQEGRLVHLTKGSMNFPNRTKILLFLVGGRAWELIDETAWSSTPGSMEQIIGIPGNSLRPILKDLADNYFIKNEKGKYQILPKGIYELESLLDKPKSSEKDTVTVGTKPTEAKSKKTSGGPSKSQAIQELINEGFFSEPKELNEIQSELGRRGVTVKQTSLPSYMLPLIRNKVLTRDYKVRESGKVWVYKKA